MKVIVHYEATGFAITEFNFEEQLKNFCYYYSSHKKNNKDLVISTSTELGIQMVRLAIYRKMIPFSEVEFRYKTHCIIPDKNARIAFWPDGFCTKNDEILEELLTPSEVENLPSDKYSKEMVENEWKHVITNIHGDWNSI